MCTGKDTTCRILFLYHLDAEPMHVNLKNESFGENFLGAVVARNPSWRVPGQHFLGVFQAGPGSLMWRRLPPRKQGAASTGFQAPDGNKTWGEILPP